MWKFQAAAVQTREGAGGRERVRVAGPAEVGSGWRGSVFIGVGSHRFSKDYVFEHPVDLFAQKD